MRINCPYCGEREITEFSSLGDANAARPQPSETGAEAAFFDYVYLRANIAGRHREHWYHGSGYHSWLVVERDTRTHQILGVAYAAPRRT